jgi:hypothetical protein
LKTRGGAAGAATVIGAVAVMVGLFLAGAYVVEAFRVLDEPDRSWLFWGVALLFGGILLVRVGVRLIRWGRSLASD